MVSNFAPEIAKCEADADTVSIILAVWNLPCHTYVFFWGFETVVIYPKNCRKYEKSCSFGLNSEF